MVKTIFPATLLCDFYKVSHREQYPTGTEFVYSTFTPRSNKYFPQADSVVVFGIQAFVKKYFIEYFNKHFFSRPKDEVIKEYERYIKFTLGVENPDSTHISDLHDLGYLPIKLSALKEGALAPIKTPVLTLENTDPRFFWLTNYFETLMSAEIWQPMTSATIAYQYRKLLDEYAIKTTGSTDGVGFQGHDFSFRGMANLEASASSGAGHLLSFTGTDTIPAISFLEEYYNADIEKELVGASIPATEHSVMSANTDADSRDELDTYLRLITEVYPNGLVSIVSDTYDFWKVVEEVLPALKPEIINRDGKVVIRPDCYDEETQIFTNTGWKYFKDLTEEDLVAQVLNDGSYEFVKPLKYVKQKYKGVMHHFHDHYGKVDLLVTPNHRMILKQRNSKTGEVNERIVFAEKLGKKGHHNQKMIRSAKAKNNGLKLTPIEKIKIAFQADGSYVTNSTKKIRFSFSKQRKMDRLELLCKEASIDFVKYDLSDGRVEYQLSVDAKEFRKDFDWVDISNLDSNWCKEFIEELSYWDSTRRSDNRFKFDTTVKKVADIAEIIGISAGYGVLMTEREDNRKDIFSNIYTLHILKDNSIGGQSWVNDKVDYDGYIYCVQVPTGRLLVKRNKCTMVCGNSGDPVKILVGDENADTVSERAGLIEMLWHIFGGTVTEQGYKVLDPHIGAIYGDSITLERAKAIVEGLERKGFASTNVVLGIGSYTYQYNTRDTLGFAMKATYAVINGEERLLFKDPKTDKGKRSQRGRVLVYKDDYGKIQFVDGLDKGKESKYEVLCGVNLLEPVFVNGKLLRNQSLSEIRKILHG